ncbi:unnamed protein product [Spirodela intermedia]|uniref:Uncharacterized protein n=1 Tax=Spirodela intermedia TaxID=51605 RepID=A0ABN7E8M9_SPIIN|nr:unnamed protein product [Spirodela intermedia]
MVLLLSSVGAFAVLRFSFCVLKWLYIFFLRPDKNLLDYGRWALAFELARRGLNLLLVGRNPDKLSEVTGEIQAQVPTVEVQTVVVDLSGDLSKGIRNLETAIEGLTAVTKAVLRAMLKKKRGHRQYCSGSTVALPSHPLLAVYAGTKGGSAELSGGVCPQYRRPLTKSLHQSAERSTAYRAFTDPADRTHPPIHFGPFYSAHFLSYGVGSFLALHGNSVTLIS